VKALHGVLLIALALLAIAAVRDLALLGKALPWNQLLDYSDFYCAGAALDRSSNPYYYEPLHRCERTVNVGSGESAMFFQFNPSVAVPAPQPPYDFLPFMAVARLPFEDARVLQAIAIVVAVALCAVALAALGVPWQVAVAALALSTAYVELEMGQIVPFALVALVLCGLALARRRDALAGLLAVITAVTPTIGVPVIVAMLLFVPRARATVVVSALVLAALSIALVGPRGLFEYFSAVLPAHADAELHFPFQYSLSWLLAVQGVPAASAKLAGTISYVVLLIVGLVLASTASAALQRRELLAFLPALCALVGGPFLHQEELCFALPALTILSIATQGPYRVFAASALCVLSIPWLLVWPVKGLFLASIFVCAVILLRLRVDLRVAVPLLVVIAAAIYAFELSPPALMPSPPPLPPAKPLVYNPNGLAQDSWRDYINGLGGIDSLWVAIKLPTWIALLAGVGVAAACSRRSRVRPELSGV
jgi:hypothetical protein